MGRPGQHGEGGLAAHPPGMRPADQQLRGGQRSEPKFVQQERGGLGDQPVQLGLVLGGLGLQQLDAPGGGAQRLHRP